MSFFGFEHADQDAPQQDFGHEEATDEAVPDGTNGKTNRLHYDSHRTEALKMGSVTGGYQEWSNMRLKYNPFPSDLDDIRDKVFKLEKPMLFNSQQFADYWGHISNMYVRQKTPIVQANGTIVEIWVCRNTAKRLQQLEPIGAGVRNKKNKKDVIESKERCKIRFRVV